MFALIQYGVTNRQLGCSQGYGHLCGLASSLDSFHRGELTAAHNWRLWFLLGLSLGGLIAAMTAPGPAITISLSMGEMYDRALPKPGGPRPSC